MRRWRNHIVAFISNYDEYDYEAELVVAIGKKAKNVSAADALDCYTCGNNFSTRDLQFSRENQWVLSKSLDGFAPIGPCIVPSDCIFPGNLAISSRINGELRQNQTHLILFFPLIKLSLIYLHISHFFPET